MAGRIVIDIDITYYYYYSVYLNPTTKFNNVVFFIEFRPLDDTLLHCHNYHASLLQTRSAPLTTMSTHTGRVVV